MAPQPLNHQPGTACKFFWRTQPWRGKDNKTNNLCLVDLEDQLGANGVASWLIMVPLTSLGQKIILEYLQK